MSSRSSRFNDLQLPRVVLLFLVAVQSVIILYNIYYIQGMSNHVKFGQLWPLFLQLCSYFLVHGVICLVQPSLPSKWEKLGLSQVRVKN